VFLQLQHQERLQKTPVSYISLLCEFSIWSMNVSGQGDTLPGTPLRMDLPFLRSHVSLTSRHSSWKTIHTTVSLSPFPVLGLLRPVKEVTKQNHSILPEIFQLFFGWWGGGLYLNTFRILSESILSMCFSFKFLLCSINSVICGIFSSVTISYFLLQTVRLYPSVSPSFLLAVHGSVPYDNAGLAEISFA
jgi:hypothetical protein